MRTLLTRSMWLAFVFATLVLLTGLALVVLGAAGGSEFEVFGQTCKSASVGLTAVALAVVSFVLLIRRVLHSHDKLSPEQLEAPPTVPNGRRPSPGSPEIRETMGRLGEKIELVLSALRSPGVKKSEIENLHEQLQAYVNAHSLFLDQELYPILSNFKDVLHDTVNIRIAAGIPNARKLDAGIAKLIELRNQTMAKLGEMAAVAPTPEPAKHSHSFRLSLVVVVGMTMLLLTTIAGGGFVASHGGEATPSPPPPVVVEVHMPVPALAIPDAGHPVDAGPRTRLSVVALPSGRVWIDGPVVGQGLVTRSVLPGRHIVAAGGS